MNERGKGNIKGMVILLVISLSGVMGLQGYLLKQTIDNRREAFDRNVQVAMVSAVLRYDLGVTVPILAGPDSVRTERVVIAQFDSSSAHLPEGGAVFHTIDPVTGTEITRIHQFDLMSSGTEIRRLTSSDREQHSESELLRVDARFLACPPIEEVLEPARLDSILTISLTEAGISARHVYQVATTAGDSVVWFSDPGQEYRSSRTAYQARLFPLNMDLPAYKLLLQLPDIRVVMFEEVWPLLLASLVFSAIVVWCFVRAIGTILEQRRLADRLIDFVNNMTHEFKTPLATLSLAGESLTGLGPDDQVQAARFGGMIQAESVRLNRHVDRILQFARLERGLDRRPTSVTDVDDLVDLAVAPFLVRVEQAGGELEISLEAGDAMVLADPEHLIAVVANLLDNAVKYSGEGPEIAVRTVADAESVTIAVSDRGRGVPAADLERVFDKYYRCPTGDVHDVKGFGLGLSYVKLIVDGLDGRVSLGNRAGGGVEAVVTLRRFNDKDAMR